MLCKEATLFSLILTFSLREKEPHERLRIMSAEQYFPISPRRKNGNCENPDGEAENRGNRERKIADSPLHRLLDRMSSLDIEFSSISSRY